MIAFALLVATMLCASAPRVVLLALIAAASVFPAQLSAQTVLGLNGANVDPIAANQGKVTVLIFVRTDCPLSNRYAPTIQQLSQQYSGKTIFWLVYPDRSETPDQIRKYLADYRYTLAAVRDPQHALVKRGQVNVTPEAAVFRADGQLVYHGRIDDLYQDFARRRPEATAHELSDAIAAALRNQMPAIRVTHAIGCYISDLQ